MSNKGESKENPHGDKVELKLSMATNAEKKKAIEETYKLYSSQTLELTEDINAKRGMHQSRTDKAISQEIKNFLPEEIVPFKSNVISVKPIKEIKPAASPVKEITIDTLKPELQKSLKKSLDTETKDKVNKILKDMEKKGDKFFTKGENNVFGNITNSDKTLIAKKLAEMEVTKEVTEINVSAIVSCLNNINK